MSTKRATTRKPHPDTVRLDKLEALANGEGFKWFVATHGDIFGYTFRPYMTALSYSRSIRAAIDAAPEPRRKR